jgi:hypothetical protein
VIWDVFDPEHRAVLEAARAWGVPPSIFMGRQRTSTITDWAGAQHFTHDAEWTEEDRTAAVALARYEAELCPGCRHPLAETTDPANEERYVVPHPIRCHRCTATAQAQDRFEDMLTPSALLIPVELRPAVLDDAQVGAEPIQ